MTVEYTVLRKMRDIDIDGLMRWDSWLVVPAAVLVADGTPNGRQRSLPAAVAA